MGDRVLTLFIECYLLACLLACFQRLIDDFNVTGNNFGLLCIFIKYDFFFKFVNLLIYVEINSSQNL